MVFLSVSKYVYFVVSYVSLLIPATRRINVSTKSYVQTRLTVAHLDDYEGFDSTIGFTQWANKPASEHATVFQLPNSALSHPNIKLSACCSNHRRGWRPVCQDKRPADNVCV